MSKYWDVFIHNDWIKNEITEETIDFAERFGKHLARKGDDSFVDNNLTNKKPKFKGSKDTKKRPILTTSQLRKFFGEVKRQQSMGYNYSDFILLKPKLAYAVGRAKDEDSKIVDFYDVISDGIMKVSNEKEFLRFIKIFEAIVAYHKAAEESKQIENNN
jgi:CRISPR type III-A-associated protein Csm2